MIFGIGRKLRKFYALMSRCPCPEVSPHGVLPRFLYPGGMKAPGVPNAYILLPTAYYHWREDAFPPNIDVSLATSRDGVNWWQPLHREPFLRLGPDGSAASGMLFANPWPIPVGDEIWIYYAGIGRDHRQELKDPSLTGIFLARLRHDGVDNLPSESMNICHDTSLVL